jgi:hypothetical protein
VTDCAAPRHGEPEPAAPHAYLCHPCTSGLRRDLQRLPALYALVEELLDPRRAGDAGGAGDGLPVSEAAVEWRSQVRHDLAWWTADIASRCRAAAPADTRVPALAGWLCGQVRWVSFRPLAGDMAATFADARHSAAAITDPRPPSWFIIPDHSNWCPACRQAGMLRIVRRRIVCCAGCGHEWDNTQLMRLGRDIIRATTGTAA